MKKNKTIRIQKGQDPYLAMRGLAEYCLERGWKVVREYADIVSPKGKEASQFLKDVKDGKIKVMPESKRKEKNHE